MTTDTLNTTKPSQKQAELLCPAGTFKNMQYAFAYGADAVYAGQARYSLRVRNNDFDEENLAKGIAYAHSLGKKFYVVVNIQAHNAKLKTFIEDIRPVIEMKPDALIMSDAGMIMMVREHFPHQDIHLSVQANAVNWATVKFWKQMGVSRVIVSRELSLKEINEIIKEVPDMEIEVFVHGALCMAYSGRCLLSGYINKRDANQGTCTNACRWSYNTYKATENETGDIVPASPEVFIPSQGEIKNVNLNGDVVMGDDYVEKPSDEVVLIEEQGRKGELMAMYEDEHGTYIMNSKDLRAVELVPDLVNMGVHSLKIEGRTKSHYYVARTTQVYRRAIDDAYDGKPFDVSLITALDGLANRGYTEGFLRRHIHSDYQNYDYGSSKTDHQQFVAEVLDINDEKLTLTVKNKLSRGDEIEIMTPQGNLIYTLDKLWDKKGNEIDSALGSGWVCQIINPFKDMDKEILKFALVMKKVDEPIFT
ncbi:tRNA 5-hydroxyuridine modification protein YegQ [Moraxella bovis]|uniref:prephenate-dependent tRNA uridine(34) hydroxylase TrhP n=1 Tax=Moraxella bovis TaxID=476 RepID=UPI002226EC5C|nr:tRNA 5-hydroxyuridine modification protein YegQ [Moraxella bovis]UYZ68270.1 tRNA 5-hydroxyuridine modification protein YegQ [Moraxella bovis]UYZ70643.1 tRNA 5-hydroxyuridine modification protein YegQ [Moraxella bovis]UYZ73423.1 tRNA 5-hydroxyuridine modification protein YegQ [Moraxella bovis]UZA13952.1 tRNA 5-hydroxyuridine modification protein YegQ [Moraxella bovis]UZA27693.1 tRNA 5-hydroxyuridine modification protein YegQ [Moraxella bovis]